MLKDNDWPSQLRKLKDWHKLKTTDLDTQCFLCAEPCQQYANTWRPHPCRSEPPLCGKPCIQSKGHDGYHDCDEHDWHGSSSTECIDLQTHRARTEAYFACLCRDGCENCIQDTLGILPTVLDSITSVVDARSHEKSLILTDEPHAGLAPVVPTILSLEARRITANDPFHDGSLFAAMYLDRHTSREHHGIDLNSGCLARTAVPSFVLDMVSDWILDTITPWLMPEAYSISSQFNQTRRLGSPHSHHMFAQGRSPRTCPHSTRTMAFRMHACSVGTHDQYTFTPHRYREISHFDHKSVAAVAQ